MTQPAHSVSPPYAARAQSWTGISTVTAVLCYALPYFAVAVIDLVVLGRGSIHHLGDYSGFYSLGLGWIDGLPYVDFVWPAWTFGQISAVLALIIGYPILDLSQFYDAWAVLNGASVLLGGWLLARLLRDLEAPAWSALVFGLLAGTMPVITTGWNHSNPYVPLCMLLIPATAAMVRRAAVGKAGRLDWYEAICLGIVGFAIANNFLAAILAIGFLAAVIIARPGAVLAFYRDCGETTLSEATRLVFTALLALFPVQVFIYVIGALGWPGIVSWLGGPVVFAAAFAAIRPLMRNLRYPPDDLLLSVYAILVGWAISANILAAMYFDVGMLAVSTTGRGESFSWEWLVPQIAFTQLDAGTHWSLFMAFGGYIGGAMALVAGLLGFLGGAAWAVLRAAGAFALVVLALTMAAVGPTAFPTGFYPEMFGISGRYLWLGVTSVAAVFYAIIYLRPTRVVCGLLLLAVTPLALASLQQSVDAKRVIIENVDTALNKTNTAIDKHLQRDPRNLVLVGNAYYPEEAQTLYAHHNSLRALPKRPVSSLRDGRIRYMGRHGTGHYRDPIEVMKNESLCPDNILVITEKFDFPKGWVVEWHSDPIIDVFIVRLPDDPACTAG